MVKRNLFKEIEAGFKDLREEREGKITLKNTTVDLPAKDSLTPAEIAGIRNRLNMSQSVFARKLRINPKTLQKWERGETQPRDTAVTLIRMVEKYPDTLDRVEALG